MKILLDASLKPFVHAELANAMDSDPDGNRKELMFAILAQFVRSGEAERFVRPDGRIAWRASRLLLERIAEEEAEAEMEAEELDG